MTSNSCCTMNSVLSTLTWGTWDDAEWGVTRSVDTSADIPTTTATAESAESSQKQRSLRKLRKKGLQAPKNSQLWFEELLERVEGTSFGRTKSTYRCNPLKCLHESEEGCNEVAETAQGIPWADLPDGIHPRDGKLPAERARNKRQQVDNLAIFLQRILRSVSCGVLARCHRDDGYIEMRLINAL